MRLERLGHQPKASLIAPELPTDENVIDVILGMTTSTLWMIQPSALL
jgi:hypothetical protein